MNHLQGAEVAMVALEVMVGMVEVEMVEVRARGEMGWEEVERGEVEGLVKGAVVVTVRVGEEEKGTEGVVGMGKVVAVRVE
jgi:hypothetical protein